MLMLLVSWTSLVLQGLALTHQVRQRPAAGAERLAGRGYIRTAACRVAAATVYVVVALLQVAGVRINGSGGLTPEALVIFSAVQMLWLSNAALDIAVRHKLRQRR
jgi:secreted trypsin-like serine protease